LVPFVVAPVIHIGEAYVFRLPARYELFGRVPILTTLKTPLLYFSGAILLWICIEFALSFSNGVYQTPTLLEMFVFLTIIQISNIFVMDLAFWIIHGPFGLHHPLVYEHLHAKHHRQRVSTFSTGPDLSPIDMLGEVTLFAVVPIGCGLALGFNSLEFMFCSLVNTLMISTWAHSPYNIAKIAPHASVTQYLVLIFPWLAENPHQGHHAKIECNYSIYGLWDKVFNTFQPMTEEDQNTARAIQETDLKKPKTLAFFYPKNSIAPYVEQLVSYAACLVVWYFLSVLNWQPIVRISDSILPFSN